MHISQGRRGEHWYQGEVKRKLNKWMVDITNRDFGLKFDFMVVGNTVTGTKRRQARDVTLSCIRSVYTEVKVLIRKYFLSDGSFYKLAGGNGRMDRDCKRIHAR